MSCVDAYWPFSDLSTPVMYPDKNSTDGNRLKENDKSSKHSRFA